MIKFRIQGVPHKKATEYAFNNKVNLETANLETIFHKSVEASINFQVINDWNRRASCQTLNSFVELKD